MAQSEAGAVGRRTVDRETLIAARLDPDALMPRYGVADTGLRLGGVLAPAEPQFWVA